MLNIEEIINVQRAALEITNKTKNKVCITTHCNPGLNKLTVNIYAKGYDVNALPTACMMIDLNDKSELKRAAEKIAAIIGGGRKK